MVANFGGLNIKMKLKIWENLKTLLPISLLPTCTFLQGNILICASIFFRIFCWLLLLLLLWVVLLLLLLLQKCKLFQDDPEWLACCCCCSFNEVRLISFTSQGRRSCGDQNSWKKFYTFQQLKNHLFAFPVYLYQLLLKFRGSFSYFIVQIICDVQIWKASGKMQLIPTTLAPLTFWVCLENLKLN